MVLRKLGFLAVVLGLAIPAWPGDRVGSISGYVRDASGVPQMGALVEVFGAAAHGLRLFTNEKGFYSIQGVAPGTYSVKVSAPSFMPSLRERIGLRSGGAAVVNVTLRTLFEAFQVGPVRTNSDDEDWKWVLRSASNRPILRVFEDGTAATVSEGKKDEHDLKGQLAFVAGSRSDGFGGGADMSTGFSLEKSLFTAGTVGFSGNVGYNGVTPSTVLRTSYKHKMANGSEPQIALTMRRLGSTDASLRNATLQALALTTSDEVTLADVLELRFGSELQTIQFLGRVTAFRPFGSADLHLSPNTLLSYGYSTSEPNGRGEKGFDSAPADLSESGPRVSILGYAPTVERAHHQEVSLSRRMGKNNLQIAVYSDRVSDPALTGLGESAADSGDVLADPYSGTFTYRGADLNTRGMRMVLQRKLAADLTATLDFAYGGVLDLARSDVALQDVRQSSVVRNRQSVAAKMSGKLPGAKTEWIASYRWTSGTALTPVDMFNASSGQTDPFLNVFLRQPIPGTSFLPVHMDALIDVRNLLAQGYVPVMGRDGRTVYLVQSARAVRGGVAFTF